MCGIAVLVDFVGDTANEAQLAHMCEAIRHRGPDDRGIVRLPRTPIGRSGPTAALGSQRLSIIDVAGGHQPIANEDQTIWTVLNGEIYNFAELRQQLERAGHRFATHSDTEVIVHLYEERGEDFVSALDGMFALALWDERRHTLVLARDRFGKKPLLYAETGDRLAAASEFSALLDDPAVSREIDHDALDCYLAYMSIPAPLTIYRGIRKVPPAHMLVRDRQGSRLRRYWSLAYQPKRAMRDADAEAELMSLFTEAVRKRLISEVPLGAFLSGGVDSSAVVAVMAKLMNRPVKTFSIGFGEAGYNELPHARVVADAFGCEHHEFVVRPNAVEVLPTLVRHFGEPFADSSAIPTYYLSRLTREHVTVALNGDGGDEAFAGYRWHLANREAERWQRLPAPLRTAIREITGRVADPADRRSWLARALRFSKGADRSRPDRYRAWVGVFSQDLERDLLRDAATGASATMIDRLFADVAALDPVDAMLAVDTAFYLPTDLLVKMDIMTMANSIEGRSPFLDHHLVEFAARLPSAMKLRGGTSKSVLKRAFRDVLPPSILRRGKSGFAVPIARWLREDLRDFVRDTLVTRRLAERGLFNAAVVERLVDEHQSRRADHSHRLWILLMFELWHRELLDRVPVHGAAAATPAGLRLR
jgi:asparagine synthase (glutamine-hydrolysing)